MKKDERYVSVRGSMHPANGSLMLKGLTQPGAIPLPVVGEKERGSTSLKLSLSIQHTILSIDLLAPS